MNANWIFDDGSAKHACTSFPYAYRFMHNCIKKAIEAKKDTGELIRKFKIVNPLGRVYNYDKATELATQQGLLTPDGNINSREFKKKD